MKKFLMVTTAIAGAFLMSNPADAALNMKLDGYFRGYMVHADNDIPATYSNEIRRDTELHLNGETALDTGVTAGAHLELKVENGNNAISGDEVYAYLAGDFGRTNLGSEDGAAYLLQVNAPSADSNIDGLESTISAFRTAQVDLGFIGNESFRTDVLQYAQTDFSKTDRITYITPKFAGFQAGISYAPKTGLASNSGAMSSDKDIGGVYENIVAGDVASTAQYKNPYELSARYDGEFQGFGFEFGAGWSSSSLEKSIGNNLTNANLGTGTLGNQFTGAATAGTYWLNDGVDTYNLGANFMFENFSVGGVFMKSQTEVATDGDITTNNIFRATSGDLTRTTYVLGAAYDFGPYHVGMSYLDRKTEQDALIGIDVADSVKGFTEDDSRITLGGGYSFGPGMTLRGSVAWASYDVKDVTPNGTATLNPRNLASSSKDATQFTVGTDVKF